MATKKAPVAIERAGNNIVSLGDNDQKMPAPTGYATYTKMYKSHPIVRATIDKLAKTATATGYTFVTRDTTKPVNAARQKTLLETFARSRAQFLLRQTYTDILVYGDAYWFITKSRLGVPYAFVRVHPSQMAVVIDKTTREITSYIVRDSEGIETQFKPEEITHFMLFDPDNDVYGLSPLESLTSTVAQDLFAQQYNESFFANNAQTGVVFNMRNASKEEVERNREFLKKDYVGSQNAHKPLLLEGDVSVQRSVSTPAEMQFIEGRKSLMQEILAVFDMPYTKLGGAMESANRSQSAENDKSFRAESIVPLQNIVEEGINEQLIIPVFKFDDLMFAHNDVDQRDEKTKMDLYVQGMTNGIYTINWVNGQLGLPDVQGGDEPYISTPLGLMPVSKLAEAADAILQAKNAPPPVPGGAGGTVPEGAATPGGNLPNQKAPKEPDPNKSDAKANTK